jgi:putative hydrolase of the HAD superfamily
MIRTLLFDLDDTLYPPGSGIMEDIRRNIHSYILTFLGLTDQDAEALRRRYFQEYGTTMRGLQVNHHIDADEFLHYVHDIPIEAYLEPNPQLEAVLAGLSQDKIVFTNASREHAERVLDRLGIRHHFRRIVDVRDMDYESKPQPSAYQRICALLEVSPEECLLVEDNSRNLVPARELGMTTILVQDGRHDSGEHADYVIRRIEDIGGVIERLPR